MSPALAWIGRLAHQQALPVPWARMVRMGVAVAVPVTVGALVGQLGLGLMVSIGALGGCLADAEGPYLARVSRIGLAAIGGVIGFVLGGLVYGDPWLTPLLIVAGGLVAGVVSVLGAVASLASLQFLLYLIIASGADFGPVPRWILPVCYVVGILWSIALTVLGGIGRGTAPERATVAALYMHIAEYMDAVGTSAVEERRRALTGALNAAYDAVLTARAHIGGSVHRVRSLAALVNAATPVIEATTALAAEGKAVPEGMADRLRRQAADIRRGRLGAGRSGAAGPGPLDTSALDVVGTAPEGADPDVQGVMTGVLTIDDILRADGVDAAGPSPVTRALRLPGTPDVVRLTLRDRAERVVDALSAGRATWLPTLRLVLCLAAAEVVAALFDGPRPYWIVMTVAVTLKPDFGSVFARAVQRGLGTIVGVLVGSAILVLSPGLVVPLLAIAVFSALMPMAQRRNYGLFAVFLTPVIVLLLDLATDGGLQLAVGRVVDTAIGCAVVVVVGYLPWTDTWRSRSRFGPRITTSAQALADYIRIGLGDAAGTRQAARRDAYRRLSDLRTVLQQALSEPPPVSTTAAAWWPVVVTLERGTDATTAVILAARRGQHPVPPSSRGVEALSAAVEAIGAFARGEQVTATPELPDDPVLQPVTAEVRAAQGLMRRMTDHRPAL